LPGALVFSIFGGTGQLIANVIDRRPQSASQNEDGGLLRSKWSPVTFLSDQEYEKILEEKLLRVEAEIALVDDNIKELSVTEQKRQQQPKAQDPNA
jgi:hypothetical protein